MGNYSLLITSCSLLLVLLPYRSPRQSLNRFYDFSLSLELVSDIISHNTVSLLGTGDFIANIPLGEQKIFCEGIQT